MTVFAAEARARTFDYRAGDVGYVPMAMSHFIENTGSEPLRFLELFKSPRFMDVSLAQWMALIPHELVAARVAQGQAACGLNSIFQRTDESGAIAGALRGSPSVSKIDPWHGQSQQRSKLFQCKWQPTWVHAADRNATSPLSFL